jgi:hypothetical protein
MADDKRTDLPERSDRLTRLVGHHAPVLLAVVLVGGVLGGLLVGYEPVGGDPDRLYRPLKSELARALGEGRLPFWSSKFGLGVPLIAESHVAAFYPPNLVLYRVFNVSTAYRLSMWLHYVALVATTYFYGRCLKFSAWGSALAGVAFALCGFQTIHSSHEPFYCVMPYLPLALASAERYLNNGRIIGLAGLAVCLGVQWTLGHFQIQMWTGGLVIVAALWRAGFNRALWPRALAVLTATAWGIALAAVQLGASWEFAREVGQTERSPDQLSYYSFPPAHWFELVLPRLIRELRMGPEDPYWHGQQTWGYEAALYLGTIPLIFAIIGALGRPASRSAALWRIVVPVSFALATMPRWWPAGYLQLLALPGIGYFRVPARYTLVTSFGLAVLAGEGFDRAIPKMRFRAGLAAAVALAATATMAAILWTNRSDVHLAPAWGGIAGGFFWGALTWLAAIAIVLAWRTRRLPSWAPVAATGVELGILFYLGTTHWGWAVDIPFQSPVLSDLIGRAPAGLVGGDIENLPVRVGLATGYPYLGFAHPYPNKILDVSHDRLIHRDNNLAADDAENAMIKLFFRRCRLDYMVSSNRSMAALGHELGRWKDEALEQLVHRDLSDPPHRVWSLIKMEAPMPEARVARRAETIASRVTLLGRLSSREDPDVAMFLAADMVGARAPARSARLVAWDGTNANVEHEGTCDLVIARTFDAGWRARIDDGPEGAVLPVDCGFQAVRLEGSGTHRVTLTYHPPRLIFHLAISLLALAAVVAIALGWAWSVVRGHFRAQVTG